MTRDNRRNLFVVLGGLALGAAAVWYVVQMTNGRLGPYNGPAVDSPARYGH